MSNESKFQGGVRWDSEQNVTQDPVTFNELKFALTLDPKYAEHYTI